MSTTSKFKNKRGKGFAQTGSFLRGRIRDASAQRGFAQSRLLTHWDEIAGPEIARISRPVEVSYAKGGFGATLVLLTTGSNAPILEMEKDKLRARVNAVYGYSAIARVRVTQTAPTGFSSGQIAFSDPKPKPKPGPSKAVVKRASEQVAPVKDAGLRAALEQLGANIISKSNSE